MCGKARRRRGAQSVEWRSAVDRGDVADRGGAAARPLGKILSQLAMPRAGHFSHRTLSRHPFFNRTPSVVTLVGLHLSLRSETNDHHSPMDKHWLISTGPKTDCRSGETVPPALSRDGTPAWHRSDTNGTITDHR